MAGTMLMGSSLAGQVPAEDARRLAEQAERRIRELQAEADRLATQTQSLLGTLRGLEIEREIRVQTLKKVEAELNGLTAREARAAARVRALEAERVAGTPGVTERLVEIYKRRRGGYVRMLLASGELRDIGRLSRGVAAVARLDRLRIEAHRRTLRAEREALAELTARREEVAAARAEAARAQRAVEAAVAAHTRRLDELDARRDLAARYVGELQEAAAALQRQMAGLSSDAPASLPLEPFRGVLEWPVPGPVVARFGRVTDRFGYQAVRNGIDIRAEAGTPVHAVHGGTVLFAARFVGFGTLVILDHGDNAFTAYGHLQEAHVTEGARVAQGSVLGRTGRTPDGDEVLYFEVRIDGRPVDPVQWLTRK